MSTELQNRLNEFEVIPPESCWHSISGRLDAEYSEADTIVAKKLAETTAALPVDAWQNIAGVLDTDNTAEISTETKSPVVPMRINWLKRIAAVLILAIGVASVYRYISLPANSGEAASSSASVLNVTPQSNNAVVPFVEDSRSETGTPRRIARINRVSRPRRSANTSLAVNNNAGYIAEAAAPDMRYASIEISERSNVSNPISVSSEPIRDVDGNIIMDEKLVSAPDNNYVTVTGPNGEQTRMSKKFFRALSYLNSDSQNDNNMGVMLQESALWKWLFQEWRTRLIQEPTFIPSSTNFLDILEMKDLLNDQL